MTAIRRLSWALMILVLPLILMGWNSLQGWRADSVLDEAHAMRQWLAAPDDRWLEALSVRERKEVISEQGRRENFQYRVALAEADTAGLRLRQVLAGLGYWLAVAALIAGPVTWIKLRLDARRARASRDYLHDHLADNWRTLGHWLVAYTGLVCASLGMILLYQLSWGWSHRADGGWVMLLFSVPVAAVMYLGVLLIERLRKQWFELDHQGSAFLGRALSRAEAPGVWAWIETVANRLNAPVPDHIVVGIDQSFFVTSVDVALQPSGQLLTGRTLYLPLPYLSALSQQETASIVGHELGHFSSRDTERGSETGARFSLMCAHFALISAEDADPAWIERPAIWMAGQFLYHFQVAVHHWSRAQELVADRAGAQVAGERVFCQALLRVIALEGEVTRLLHAQRGGDLVQALAQHLRQTSLSVDQRVIAQAIAHPFDTHPPTVQRLEHLKVDMDAALLAQATRMPSEDDRQWFGRLASHVRPTTDTTDMGTPA